jgi:hypothetical protein
MKFNQISLIKEIKALRGIKFLSLFCGRYYKAITIDKYCSSSLILNELNGNNK